MKLRYRLSVVFREHLQNELFWIVEKHGVKPDTAGVSLPLINNLLNKLSKCTWLSHSIFSQPFSELWVLDVLSIINQPILYLQSINFKATALLKPKLKGYLFLSKRRPLCWYHISGSHRSQKFYLREQQAACLPFAGYKRLYEWQSR